MVVASEAVGVKMVSSALIVDDNPADIKWCTLMMRKSKRYLDVVSAACGREALSLLTTPHPDHDLFRPRMILLDINMPAMNGFEFLEKFSAAYVELAQARTSVVLMVTSSEDPYDRERASEFELIEGYMVKPLCVKRATELADQFGDLSR